MWRNVKCAQLYVGAHKKNFTLGQLAEELINVLPRSPCAFKRILASQFDEQNNIELADLHEMISYISTTLGEEELAKYLSEDTGNDHYIESQGKWRLSDSACELCKEDSLFLSVYVDRHKVADLSETGKVEKYFSLKSLQEGTGYFITHYAYKHYTLIISTERVTKQLCIDVVTS